MIWIVSDTIFAVIFSIELFLRASKGLREFLTDKDQKLWNWFDAFLVVTALLELLVAFSMMALGEEEDQSESSNVFQLLLVLRVFRVFRVLRVLRLVPF